MHNIFPLLEGVVKSRLAPPGRVENVLECSFTTCKLRFCAHLRLARKHNPTFYDTLPGGEGWGEGEKKETSIETQPNIPI
jgi:hypothetical protein